MAGTSLPPGFRFHPTDEELVGYYLRRKTEGLEIELEVIPVIDLYKFDPWELPDKSFLPNRDMEWFFFCPRDRKYPNGSRTNRATKAGYWKATGKDRKVSCQSGVIGYRKTLVFYRGRAPLGDRTDWVMHEYRLGDDVSQGTPNFLGPFALCRVIKKNEQARKTSHVHEEPKAKQDGSSSSTGEFASSTISIEPVIISNDNSFQTGCACDDNNYVVGHDPASLWVSPDLILDTSKEYQQGNMSGYFPQHESMTSWQPYDHYEISPSSSYSNFREDFELSGDLSRFGCVSPYSGNDNFMGFYGDQDMQFEGYDQIHSLKHPKPF